MGEYEFSSVFDESERPLGVKLLGVPDISMFDGLPKDKYMQAGMLYEQSLAYLIGQREDSEAFPYWIVADHEKVIMGVNMFDNATLVAEALVLHSPYYKVIDVFCHDGLQLHLERDPQDKRFRTNHILAPKEA